MAAWHTDADLFHQWEEAEERAEKWQERYKKEKQSHEQEVGELRAQFRCEIQEIVKPLVERINVLECRIKELEAENEALREDNERLKSIINNNSNNSSQPPSGDQKPSHKKANEYNGREKQGRKRGGQKGHVGKSLSRAKVEELISSGKVEHQIIEVDKPQDGSGEYISKYECDLKTVAVVREYRYYRNEKGIYNIPQEHRPDVRYGNDLRALAVAFYNIGVMSNERIKDLLNAMSDYIWQLSDGFVYDAISRFSRSIDKDLESLSTDLRNQAVLQTDATFITVGGVQSYIRSISSTRSVLYVGMDKKTIECLKKVPVIKNYQGILVHDHETSLYHFGTGHAECNVHLLRYLTKNSQDTGNKWSDKMKSLLTRMNNERKMLLRQGIHSFEKQRIADFEKEYDAILAEGQKQNTQTRPRWASQDENSLLNRMRKYKENHLLFLHRFDVPFDNNLCERDLRKCKNRQKISGGFGMNSGRDMACRILSFIETCKRRSIHLLSAIRQAFSSPVLLDR